MKKLLAGFFLFFWALSAVAQSNECELVLNQATEEFNAGHFYEIPALLKPCLDKAEFTNEQRVRAYLLLSQAYLIVDDPIAAEDSYLKLLKADPEYVATKEKDPIDVVYLSTKFTTRPIFTPHLRVGANTSVPRTIYEIPIRGKEVNTKHVLRPGFQLGGGIDWNLTDQISLSGDVIFSYKTFKTRTNMPPHDDLTVVEKQYWIDLPIYLKYSASKGQIRPFGYVGYAANLLLGSSGTMEFINRSTSSVTGAISQSDATGPDVKLTFDRRFFNRSMVIGGGARYKIGTDYLFADIRYMAGLSNVTRPNIYAPDQHPAPDPGNLVTNSPLSQYGYVSNYFRLDNVSISFGYVRPLYNPRKIRKAKSKTVMRKIRKEKKNETQ